MAIQSVRPSVCPSHAGIVSKRRHVARCSLHCRIANCVSFCRNQKHIPQGRPLPPEILAPSDIPYPASSEFWYILPCSASTVRDRKRSSVTLNKNSAQAFQRAIHQGSTPPTTSSKWGSKVPRGVVFWTTSTIKDEKSAAKFHYIKTVSGKVVEHSIAFRVVSTHW